MASHHSLLSFAALATMLPVLLLICRFSLTQALNGGFSVDLIRRDSPASPFYDPSETPSQRMAKALRRSINRVNHFKPTSVVSSAAPPSEIVPNNGDYLMEYSVGTPPFPVLGIADTCSDLIWLQCSPCTKCYRQSALLFSPLYSTTYKKVTCASKQCHSVDRTSCSFEEGSFNCQYEVSDGDRSFTRGDLALDTLTLGSARSRHVSLPHITVGCGHNNDGTFDEKSSGIVGLSASASSLVSQLGSDSTGDKFS
ncbi:Aspartic proteinase CDR1 [Morella rubra]|uniref:Aspartic proteinase CDR1 n=1 Tax=Morella rubra TaxID=262757 RepID=A0A6A1W4J8_9ROSI|nr:Aspartic proteinase CDR1 [Morella rubra]